MIGISMEFRHVARILILWALDVLGTCFKWLPLAVSEVLAHGINLELNPSPSRAHLCHLSS